MFSLFCRPNDNTLYDSTVDTSDRLELCQATVLQSNRIHFVLVNSISRTVAECNKLSFVEDFQVRQQFRTHFCLY